MNPYWSICHIANYGNPPELTCCSNCNAPVDLENLDTHDKYGSPNNLDDRYFSKLSITQKITVVLVTICSYIGMLMTKVDSPRLVLIGIVLVAFGAVVFTRIRNSLKAKRGKVVLK